MTLVSFAMFGPMFTAPYFQDVRGAACRRRAAAAADRRDAGQRDRKRETHPPKGPDGTPGTPPVSAKTATTAGFTVMAAGLAMGAFTGLGSTTGFAAAWIAITGLGLGLAMPSAMNAAIGPLAAERSGSGSALISAVRQVGATIGVAVLGTVLSNGYTVAEPPEAARVRAEAIRGSVAGGIEVAHKMGSAALLDEVRTAFIHGMDILLWSTGGIALASALIAFAFLPRRAEAAAAEKPPEDAPRETASSGAPGPGRAE
jgi:hypothetical protein